MLDVMTLRGDGDNKILLDNINRLRISAYMRTALYLERSIFVQVIFYEGVYLYTPENVLIFGSVRIYATYKTSSIPLSNQNVDNLTNQLSRKDDAYMRRP